MSLWSKKEWKHNIGGYIRVQQQKKINEYTKDTCVFVNIISIITSVKNNLRFTSF